MRNVYLRKPSKASSQKILPNLFWVKIRKKARAQSVRKRAFHTRFLIRFWDYKLYKLQFWPERLHILHILNNVMTFPKLIIIFYHLRLCPVSFFALMVTFFPTPVLNKFLQLTFISSCLFAFFLDFILISIIFIVVF
jgi:hypothetical protein